MSMSFLHDKLKEVSMHKKEFLEQLERIMLWGERKEMVKTIMRGGPATSPMTLNGCS